MRLGGDFVFFGIGDKVKIWVREEFFHFEEEFARGGVGAGHGEVTVGEVEREMALAHLQEFADARLEVVFIPKVGVGNVDIKKVFDVAILFGKAGKFRNGEDEAIDVWVVHDANLFHIGEGALDGGGEEVPGRTAARAVEDFAGSVEELEFDGRVIAAGPGVEEKRAARAIRVRTRTGAQLQGDDIGAAIVRAASGAELVIILHEHETDVAAGVGELGTFRNGNGIMIGWAGGNAGHELDRRLVPDAKIICEMKSVGNGAGAVAAGKWVMRAGIESGEGDRFEWRKVAGNEDELAHRIRAIEIEVPLILRHAPEFVGGGGSEGFGIGSIIGGWDLQAPTEIGAGLGEGSANVGEANGTIGENSGVRGVGVNDAERDVFFL